MKRHLLDRHITVEVVGSFIFGVALFTTILVAMQELQPLTSMVVEHGVPLWTAAKIFVLSLPFFIAYAFPMSMLLSTLLAFGKLSGDSEITAMLAAGVSLYRMAAPIAIIGVLVSVLAISFNEWVSPVATQQKNMLYDAAIRSGVPSNRPVYFEKEEVGKTLFLLRADNYDSETKKLLHPTIVFYLKGKPAAIEWAESGTWQGGLNWDLQSGFGQKFGGSAGGNGPRLDFVENSVSLAVSIDQLLTASQDPNALTYAQLAARVESKIKEGRTVTDINTDRVTLYSKISIPFASLIFALIGFPLGIRRQRSGGAIGFALSIAIIFIYYLIYQYASILGNNGAASPMLCAWIPDIVGLLVGLVLLKKASI